MSHNNNRITELFNKYLSNTASAAEELEFFGYVENPFFKSQIEELISDTFDNQTEIIDLSDRGRRRILDNVLSKEKTLSSKPRYRKIVMRASIAASVILCLGIVFYLYNLNTQTDQIAESKNLNVDIFSLDSTQAYLTLADGKRISLSASNDGKVAQQSGVTITKTAEGQVVYSILDLSVKTETLQYNTIETPKGGQYQISLPDGTKVWLNAASSLKYPVSFTSLDERKVFLNGEGYFEVSKDKNKPFRVMTDDRQEVEVLGTHFNIKAYSKDIKTTLLEGMVKVSLLMRTSEEQSILLKPGQMAVNEDSKIVVSELPFAANQIAWREGYLVFNNANIKEIMADLANWYNLDVEYQGDMSKIYFHGNYLRSRNVLKLLKSLELTNKVGFKIEGRRVIVTQGKDV